MTQIQELALADIHVEEGHNPRRTFDGLDVLAASIKEHGVLVPVIVTKNGDGFTLIAGERRLRAAAKAKLPTIPAVIRESNAKVADVALVENLQRDDLTPIEEAKAYQKLIEAGQTVKGLAKTLSVPGGRITGRLQLLELSGYGQEAVDKGLVTLGSVPALAAITEASPAAAEAVVELMTLAASPEWMDEPVRARDLEDKPGWVLSLALEVAGNNDGPIACQVFEASDLNGMGYENQWERLFVLTPEVEAAAGKLREALAALPEEQRYSYGPRHYSFQLDTEDRDAARAFGCLLELGDRWTFFTDPVWLLDRLAGKAQKLGAAMVTKGKAETKAGGDKGGSEPLTAAEAVKEKQKAERAEEKLEAIAAHDRNVGLGLNLIKKLDSPKVTVDALRLVALTLLDQPSVMDTVSRSWRLVDETRHEAVSKKDGTLTRWKHPEYNDEGNEEAVLAKIAKAKTPEQMLGVILQLLAAVKLADAEAVPRAQRIGIGYDRLGLAGSVYGGPDDLTALADKVLDRYQTPQVKEARETSGKRR